MYEIHIDPKDTFEIELACPNCCHYGGYGEPLLAEHLLKELGTYSCSNCGSLFVPNTHCRMIRHNFLFPISFAHLFMNRRIVEETLKVGSFCECRFDTVIYYDDLVYYCVKCFKLLAHTGKCPKRFMKDYFKKVRLWQRQTREQYELSLAL